MIDAFLSLSPMLGKALLHFLWQGALLGLATALALLLLRDARPQVRYALTCAALLVALLLPVLTLAWLLAIPAGLPAAITLPATASNLASPLFLRQALAGDAAPGLVDGLPWLVACWALGAGLLSLRMLGGLYWITRLRQRAWRADDPALQASCDRLATRLGLRLKVPLRLTRDAVSPLAIGCWRPLVLLPASLVLHMPAPLLEALIAHELAHIRRHDYLVNLLQSLVETLLFYHPVTWWLSRRIRSERELIADALAAEALGERRPLALALSELERLLDPTPSLHPHLAPAAHGGQLMTRIQHLLRPRTPAATRGQLLPLFGFSLIALALASAGVYAHAAVQKAAATTTTTLPTPPTPPAPPAPPAPPTAPGIVPPAPPAPPVPPVPTFGDSNGYTLVRNGETRYTFSGDLDDRRLVDKLRAGGNADFLLVRKDGRRFMLRDAALLAAVEDAWAPLDPLNGKMDALQAKMTPHQQRLEQLQAEMEQLPQPQPSPELEAASTRLQALAAQQRELAAQQARLARRAHDANDDQREALERQMDHLSERMDALSSQMDAQSALVERQSDRMQQQGERMQAIGDRMQAASQPMQAIGEQMNAVGERIQRAADTANAKTHRLIERAFARGLAQPAG